MSEIFQKRGVTANDLAEKSKVDSEIMFSGIVGFFKREFDNFWFNKDYTPQEMVDAWGEQILLFFTNSEKTKAYILSVDPNALEEKYLSPPMVITPNQDGTVTLTEKPE